MKKRLLLISQGIIFQKKSLKTISTVQVSVSSKTNSINQIITIIYFKIKMTITWLKISN
jgi:hypothetical protein